MNFKKTILLTATALVVIASCKKEEQFEAFPQNPATGGGGGSQLYNSIQDFFNQNGAPVQTFTLNASTGGTFTGADGGVFTFQPNSFVTQSGGPVTGNVTVALREVYTKKEMILSGIPPMSFGNGLKTGGEYNIKVKQGSQMLKLDAGMSYTVQLPVDANLGAMNVYNGVEASGEVNWVANFDSSNSAVYNPAPQSYLMVCDSLNWINCDAPYSSASPGTSVVNITGGTTNNNNCVVFAVVTNNKVAWQMYPDLVTPVPNQSVWTSAPQGEAGTFVVLYVNLTTGQLYSSFTNVTFSSTPITANLTPTTEAALEAQLDLLD